MLERAEKDGLLLFGAPALESEGVSVVFTTRLDAGGSPPYDGLNLSYSVGDDRETVRANREAVARAIDIDIHDTVFGRQVHSTNVWIAGDLERARGSFDFESALPGCDAIITSTPGLSVCVLTADCVPVAVVCEDGRAVAAVHAGWRGLAAGILKKSVRLLSQVSSSEPRHMTALVGPHLMSCCFEVGEDIAGLFESRFGAGCVSRERKRRVAMADACRTELMREGLKAVNIHESGECTCCCRDYFSYRRSGGLTGRQALLVRPAD